MLAERGLLTGFAEHPAVPLHPVRQISQLGDELLLKSRHRCKNSGTRTVSRGCPPFASNTIRRIGTALARRLIQSPGAADTAGFGFQKYIGALSHAEARQRFLRLFDQPAIELDQRRCSVSRANRADRCSSSNRRPSALVASRIEIVGPVALHPGFDQFAVRRLLSAQHQIDLERFIDESRHRRSWH